MTDELRRAVDFMQSVDDRVVERHVPFAHGVALFNDRLDRVHDLNFLRVEHPAWGDDLIAEADRLQAHLRHRQLRVDDEALGRELEGEFRRPGWEIQRNLVMLYRDDLPGSPDLVEESTLDALAGMTADSLRSEPWGRDEEVVRQLVERRRLVDRAIATRYFTVAADGRPVSRCELYLEDSIAQVEDVETIAAYRNRGYGRAVVEAAVRAALEAGSEFLFIIADADDWPKELYRKIGFEDAGLTYRFVRKPNDG